MTGSNAAVKLGGLALVVAVVFGAAYGIGKVVGPVAAEPAPQAEAHEGMGEDSAAGEGHGDGHDAAASVPKGLQVSEGGVTLDVLTDGPAAGRRADFAFRILDEDGHAVTGFQLTHDKLMHLVVARRDLSGFQHVHPVMAADGTWRIPLTFPSAGDFRVFADFQRAGEDEGQTLGIDVPVAGTYTPTPLPQAALTAVAGEYRVTLSGKLEPGTTSKLTLSVDKGGVPVTDLQPYLAAYGHLIALRQGDLAYLHVHPDGEPGDGTTRPGPNIVFFAEVPTAGTYRLYLDFKHGDVVRTAEFTAVATKHGH
ncbi:MAG: hypothetical protein WBA97_16315 [Actinophytocola sp.]|uniref:hypothetical protein n=1 Tax=Actinophytocola sp. TaxID=1872138 RepID=UPI003C71B048